MGEEDTLDPDLLEGDEDEATSIPVGEEEEADDSLSNDDEEEEEEEDEDM